MSGVVYFAYGSNMSSARLAARVAGCRSLGRGVLPGYRLAFHLPSPNDGSGKCDIYPTGRAQDAVHGVLYRLPARELAVLDAFEGHPWLYLRRAIEIRLPRGGALRAEVYLGRRRQDGLRPFDWYRAHVLRGAREHGLPPEYVAAIASTPCIEDPDAERRRRELAIYRASSAPSSSGQG